MAKALEGTYRDVFVPAISKHARFSEAKLLRAISSEAHSHQLVIAFESEELQKMGGHGPSPTGVAEDGCEHGSLLSPRL
jgi:hypothetical protein